MATKTKVYPSQEKLCELFEYKDGGLYWREARGQRTKAGARAGALKNKGYRAIQIDGVQYQEHRLIYIFHNGPIPDGLQIDHISGKRDDNRIENLRTASNAENQRNQQRAHARNKTGFLGVCWHEKNQYYEAQLQTDGVKTQKYFTVRAFGTKAKALAEAVAWRSAEAAKQHGDFAAPEPCVIDIMLAILAVNREIIAALKAA